MYDYIVIDGLNFSHRYHWKFIRFAYKGKKTGMYFGVMRQVLRFKETYPKAKIIFCWDSPNLRKKMISQDYKADRKKKPDDFHECVNNTKDFLAHLGIDQFYSVGIEADDIAARFIKKHSKKKILLVTTDSDWFQFMTKKTDVYRDGEIWQLKDCLNKVRFKSRYEFILFCCIVGTHNNVPGVKGIGEKKYDDVRKIVSGETNIKKVIRKLKNQKDKVSQMIYKSRELVENNYKLVVPIISGYKIKSIPKKDDQKELIKLLDKFALKSIKRAIVPEEEDELLKDF